MAASKKQVSLSAEDKAALRTWSEANWRGFIRLSGWADRFYGYETPVKFGPSKLPYLAGPKLRVENYARHFRASYGATLAGWGAALGVAAWYFTDRSLSDILPNTTAGFWSWLPGWQSGRVNSRN